MLQRPRKDRYRGDPQLPIQDLLRQFQLEQYRPPLYLTLEDQSPPQDLHSPEVVVVEGKM
jgi:hypothetical protein